MSTTPGVGEDIEALCGRCGQVWHVVMAKMGEKIAKVVCKRCGGHHRYRNENEDPASEPPRSRTRTFSTGRSTRSAKTPTPIPVVPAFDPAKPMRPYAAGAVYAAGERITHPRFGVGVVAGSPGAGKIDVVFPTGPRVLAAAKIASSLARPVAVAVPVADRPPSAK
jgi:hypothetical protein